MYFFRTFEGKNYQWPVDDPFLHEILREFNQFIIVVSIRDTNYEDACKILQYFQEYKISSLVYKNVDENNIFTLFPYIAFQDSHNSIEDFEWAMNRNEKFKLIGSKFYYQRKNLKRKIV